MSYNRLGTLCAGLVGLGWLLAIGINLIFWAPQMGQTDPTFFDDPQQFLAFVHHNWLTWRLFHIGTSTGLLALIGLIGLLHESGKADKRGLAITLLGIVGATFGLLASLVDHLATPQLARLSMGGVATANYLWQSMEPWRDDGLKTVSYWLLGIWAVWYGGRHDPGRITTLTRIIGISLLALALFETIVPTPWRNQWGDSGLGGLIFLLLPAWGLGIAHWFWQQEHREEKSQIR